MRQFQISAIVDERMLWELMNLLEKSKARGILARPHNNGEDQPATKATRAPKGHRRLGSPSGDRGPALEQVKAACLAAFEAGQPSVKSKDIRAQLALKRPSIDRSFWMLNRDGFLKRVGLGEYSRGRKLKSEEAPAT